jgi:hypothetical protein
MEILLLVSFYCAFVMAVLEQLVDLGRFKALVSFVVAIAGVAFLGPSTVETVLVAAGASFAGPFLVALGDRISVIQLAVPRQIGPRE